MKKSPTNALFAANIPFNFTDEQLGNLFDSFGIVVSCRIARDPKTGQSRGFGFVELAPERARQQAIAALNGKVIEGRRVEVRVANDPAPAQAAPHPNSRPALAHSGRPAVAAAPDATRRPVVVEYKKPVRRLAIGR